MAMISIGIVGLPNVGKSTLFNALTQAEVAAENYPFCTIDPHTGIVPLVDERLTQLATLSGSKKTVPATMMFTDIAGLVKGASKGEGLGNAFLQNIRMTTALVHVVRCFDDPNVTHVHGHVDPIQDVSIIQTELILADLETVQQAIEKQHKKTKSGDKADRNRLASLQAIESHLETMMPLTQIITDLDPSIITDYGFLTAKNVIYVANVADQDVPHGNAYQTALCEYATAQQATVMTISASLEQELSILNDEDKKTYLAEYGMTQSGLEQLACAGFDLLGLQTYLTTGPQESRSWVIKKGTAAPQAAGEIHSDFEKGFIRANVVNYGDLIQAGSIKKAKEVGVWRQEGKDYVMQDGDVVEFLFNVSH